jgi:hypothetical protein
MSESSVEYGEIGVHELEQEHLKDVGLFIGVTILVIFNVNEGRSKEGVELIEDSDEDTINHTSNGRKVIIDS